MFRAIFNISQLYLHHCCQLKLYDRFSRNVKVLFARDFSFRRTIKDNRYRILGNGIDDALEHGVTERFVRFQKQADKSLTEEMHGPVAA